MTLETVDLWPRPYQIYNHIFSECGSPLSGHLTHVHHFLWVVSIHMEDGGVNHSSYICGVRRGPRKSRISGESNLQIYSYMYFTTSMSMIRLKVKNFQTIFFFNTLLWHKAKKKKKTPKQCYIGNKKYSVSVNSLYFAR